LRNLSISSRQHATADDAAWALNNAHLRALEISVGSLPAGRALAMLLSASPDLTPAAAETAAVLLCDAFGVATTAPAVTVLSQISYGLGGMGAGVVTSAILTAWALETR
jgi:hypothetical protein